jgi:hypothetical protein
VNAVLIGIVPVGAIIGAGIAPFLMRLFTRKFILLNLEDSFYSSIFWLLLLKE